MLRASSSPDPPFASLEAKSRATWFLFPNSKGATRLLPCLERSAGSLFLHNLHPHAPKLLTTALPAAPSTNQYDCTGKCREGLGRGLQVRGSTAAGLGYRTTAGASRGSSQVQDGGGTAWGGQGHQALPRVSQSERRMGDPDGKLRLIPR